MALPVCINGFGRFDRLAYGAAHENHETRWVGMIRRVPADNMACLPRHDSTHGLFSASIEARIDGLRIDDRFTSCNSERDQHRVAVSCCEQVNHTPTPDYRA